MCESTTGVTHAAEMCTMESVLDSLSLPEDIGCKTAQLLLEEVLKVCTVVCLVYSFSYSTFVAWTFPGWVCRFTESVFGVTFYGSGSERCL